MISNRVYSVGNYFLNYSKFRMRLFLIFALIGLASCASEINKEEIVFRALQDASRSLAMEDPIVRTIKTPRRIGSKWTPYSEKLARHSNTQLLAIESLLEQKDLNMTRGEIITIMSRQLPAECKQPNLNCNFQDKFSRIDGTCNNFMNPRWGAVNTPLLRVLPSQYEDRFDMPRGGRGSNERLPNPRVLSVLIHSDVDLSDARYTNMLPQIGQFLTHDMAFTPENDLKCCSGKKDKDCWSIRIFPNDPFYSQRFIQQTCMDFTRSTAFCLKTPSGVREQINMNTAFIDLSTVYGSEFSRSNSLRFNGGTRGPRGRMRTSTRIRNFLPLGTEMRPDPGFLGSFVGGDDRVNENPGLTVLHGLFLKEHNRLANLIQERNTGWSDDLIYKETRRILIAMYQNIIYDEYLPIILGKDIMKHYNLTIKEEYSEYIPNLEPTILNEWATAAHRFGHSMVNGRLHLVNQGTPIGSFNLRDNFFISTQLTNNNGQGYEWIMGGFVKQTAQPSDTALSEDLQNFLFKEPKKSWGADLAARNIQRGRDHGLPTYNQMRQFCNLSPLTSWQEKPEEISDELWAKMGSVYRVPDDIDAFTGGLSETHMEGAITGPTFTCIMANQFYRSKFGDRFFFTHSNQAGSFQPFQILEIKKVTLSDLICLNTEQMFTTKSVFHAPSEDNPWISCHDQSRTYLDINLFL